MFSLFKPKYKKRADGKVWTKKALIERMYMEIGVAEIAQIDKGNLWKLNRKLPLYISFGNSNYADANTLEIVDSIFIKSQESEFLVGTLFEICKQYFGKNYRSLTIFKDENFEESRLQRECREVYRPLFMQLKDEVDILRVLNTGYTTIGDRRVNFFDKNLERYIEK